MKKSYCLLIISVMMFVFIVNEPWIHNKVTCFRASYDNWRIKRKMHSEDDKVISDINIKKEYPLWCNYRVIAHGGGGIDGKCCSNSLDALDFAYSRGTRLFDVDINYTSDSVMVLRHSWKDNTEQGIEPHFKTTESEYNKIRQKYYFLEGDSSFVMDSIAFVNHKPFGLYKPLTVLDLLSWMRSHPDAYVLPDFKGEIANQMNLFLEILRKTHNESLLSKIIVRIRKFEDYELVRKKLPPDQIALRKYETNKDSYASLLNFCKSKNIRVIILSQCDSDDNMIASFEKYGIRVYVGVVDYLSDFLYYEKKGAYGVVSNFLYENQIEEMLKYGK